MIFKTKLSDEEGFSQLYEKIVQLKLIAPDGKNRQTDCTDVETLLRIIQSVQSKKAEPYDIHKHHEFEFKE
ncbi:hypothetical protein IJ732_07995 [bacterium]|nr:hypothetical protein [bacterium]